MDAKSRLLKRLKGVRGSWPQLTALCPAYDDPDVIDLGTVDFDSPAGAPTRLAAAIRQLATLPTTSASPTPSASWPRCRGRSSKVLASFHRSRPWKEPAGLGAEAG